MTREWHEALVELALRLGRGGCHLSVELAEAVVKRDGVALRRRGGLRGVERVSVVPGAVDGDAP